MNGEEKEVKKPRELNRRTVTELTEIEKIDLVVFSSMPVAETLFRIMEDEILEARDLAMATDPVNVKQVLALQAEAHAMARFYTRIRNKIEGSKVEHFGNIAAKAVEEAIQDQDELENLIISNL